MDIPDIEHVVQFAVPTSLLVLNQCVGHAGCSGQHALAIILVEPSVFQTVKKKKKAEENKKAKTQRGDPELDALHEIVKIELNKDEDLDLATIQASILDNDEAQIEHKKKMEAGIQAWCLAKGCRVEVSDQYFNNPLRSNGISTFLMPLGVTH
jgi:superfamily II DNA helicase RecQ